MLVFVVTAEEAKSIVAKIHALPGTKIAEQVIKTHANICQEGMCLRVFASWNNRSIQELMGQAVEVWQEMSGSVERQPSAFCTLNSVVKQMAGEHCHCIVQFGMQHHRRLEAGQPFILLPDSLEGNFKVCIMVDQIPFMTFAGRDNETTCVKSLVILLVVYFLLNLEYPRSAKAAYEKLQNLVCVGKD